ncbi:unnamed protein product [Allacma fusca]|uniref:JmjC domain-containing protein n=1 Tax=Allacma fusca TaxID=39272 RepID=A0A8J2LJI7_9HEXA|nr:unnamed protein product [Allacma fusca]
MNGVNSLTLTTQTEDEDDEGLYFERRCRAGCFPENSFRGGQKGAKRETQWESTCKKLSVTWKMLSEWDSSEEIQLSEVSNLNWWLYYDYKYMAHCLPAPELQKFSWAALGFPERDGKDSTLWIGTRDSYTPCHYDTYGCNLVCQVFGRKKWILFPPQDTKFLRPTRVPYEESSVYSEINLTSLTDSDAQKLSSCKPVEVTLEPGDVLFVPSKWWHFVKSEEFSISVNTWIELPDDSITRLQEAVMRTVINFAVNTVSPNSVSDLLNPNEMELLDLTESDLKDLLKSSSNQVSSKHTQNEGEILINQKADCPPVKKTKLMESCFIKSFDQLQTSVSCVEKLKPMKLTASADLADNFTYETEPPTDEKAYLKHLINAIGHPNVLKHISEQFLLHAFVGQRSVVIDNIEKVISHNFDGTVTKRDPFLQAAIFNVFPGRTHT